MILVKNKIIEAKDAVIATQDVALVQSEEAKEAYKKALTATESALKKQVSATEMAELGWKASEDRVRQLEKSLRKSDGKLKWIAVGAAAAATAIIVLQR